MKGSGHTHHSGDISRRHVYIRQLLSLLVGICRGSVSGWHLGPLSMHGRGFGVYMKLHISAAHAVYQLSFFGLSEEFRNMKRQVWECYFKC